MTSAASPADISFACLGEFRVPWNIRGSGPKLLFISGTGGDLRRPPTVFDRLLDQHFEVLRFDQRGMGQTTGPDTPHTMADYAEDAAALMAVLDFSPAAVLGYSFGGMVAQELALRHPQRVSRLLLLCTSSGGAGGASWPLHEIAHFPVEERARILIERGDTRRDAGWQATHPALFAALLDDVLAGLKLAASTPQAAAGAMRQLEARRQHDAFDRLPGLAMPVAVVGGVHDGIAAPPTVKNLAARIPGALLRMFDGGHLVHVQNPAAAREIVAWLGA